MYSARVIYSWGTHEPDASGLLVIDLGTLEGAGFPGYGTPEHALGAFTRWMNRTGGHATVHSVQIERKD
jgi:hypothetical protein